jgi:hypothetical protein
MAFLVCFSRKLEDHAQIRAAYLPQTFYELIFTTCLSDDAEFDVLRDIARLRYKSPSILIGADRLVRLLEELDRLREAVGGRDGISDLSQAAEQAISDGCSLTISGDMYPELGALRL